FTLFLPARQAVVRPKKALVKKNSTGAAAQPTKAANGQAPDALTHIPEAAFGTGIDWVGDDRGHISMGDHVVLIAENDLTFARLLLGSAREKGFKGLVTSLGASALALASDHAPEAILLDIHLPDMQGWRVLDRLKNDMATRHIPVYVISTDDAREQALDAGAYAFIPKPVRSKDQLDAVLDGIASAR